MLTKVRLFGKLGKKYTKEIDLAVNSIPETIRALCANFPGFDNDLKEYDYKIFLDNVQIDKEDLVLSFAKKEIKIVPIVSGSKSAGGRIITGALLLVASFYAPQLAPAFFESAGAVGAFALSAANAIGTSLILAGISEILFKPPKKEETDTEKLASKLFNGPQNTVAQGVPVPLGYGLVRTGSVVASFSIENRNAV